MTASAEPPAAMLLSDGPVYRVELTPPSAASPIWRGRAHALSAPDDGLELRLRRADGVELARLFSGVPPGDAGNPGLQADAGYSDHFVLDAAALDPAALHGLDPAAPLWLETLDQRWRTALPLPTPAAPALQARVDHWRASQRQRCPRQGAVVVLGMHRSGTSAMMGALNQLGVFLGDPRQLYDADEWNARGYYEHAGIVTLNNAQLARVGSAWDCPPDNAQLHWLLTNPDAALNERMRLRVATLQRNSELRGDPAWGFKDPRLCLTWPLWAPLLPAHRIVVCLRNPLEINHSLRKRSPLLTEQYGLRLCQPYLRALRRLATAAPEHCLLIHYDQLSAAPDASLRRLARWLGLDGDDARLAAAIASIEPQLRHHQLRQLSWPPGFEALQADYAWLQQRSIDLAGEA